MTGGFDPLPADGPRKPAFFERRSRQAGGTSRSYSQGVSAPEHETRKRQSALAALVLAVLLPPVGVVCLWVGGYLRLPFRIAATALAFAVMVLFFCLVMPEKKPSEYAFPMSRPGAVTEYSPSSTAETGQEDALTGA